MIIAAIVAAVSLVVLSKYHNHCIRRHLVKYQCDPTLYELIEKAKKSSSGFRERIRVETSTKDSEGGRYIIPILYVEYQHYKLEDQHAIISFLGFKDEVIAEFLDDKKIRPSTDIIFGVDKGKGKIYLDYGGEDISLKCLESTGEIKIYKKTAKGDCNLRVKDGNGLVTGYHRRLKRPQRNKHGDYVYWVAESVDGRRAYYTRPYLPLIDLLDLVQVITKVFII